MKFKFLLSLLNNFMDEKLSLTINYLSMANPTCDLANENLLTLFQQYAEPLFQPLAASLKDFP